MAHMNCLDDLKDKIRELRARKGEGLAPGEDHQR
jgi:hypothetical protein